MRALLDETQKHWQAIGPLLTIRGERDYAAAIERLESLLKEIGNDEQHPLYGLLDTLGTLIHAYEEENVAIPEASGPEVLEFLMDYTDDPRLETEPAGRLAIIPGAFACATTSVIVCSRAGAQRLSARP